MLVRLTRGEVCSGFPSKPENPALKIFEQGAGRVDVAEHSISTYAAVDF
ncbi:hypothetical protein ACIBF6_08930 [Streptosporangium amethystogenes]